jgi:hypothetical protein
VKEWRFGDVDEQRRMTEEGAILFVVVLLREGEG